jgi:pimeloyl-ACP methyl ester carboxylesterase
MREVSNDESPLCHRQLGIEGITIHVVEGGAVEHPAVLFLHGWPECWAVFEPVMLLLSRTAHVVAMDLPGVGDSKEATPSNDKRTLASYARGVVEELELRDATLVGHDVGGMVTYAFLHRYPDELGRAVIMNTAIPGVDPWWEVERNPRIWHFAFHAVPGLPEKLVSGHEADYFAFFYDVLSARPGGVGERARRRYVGAYSTPAALHTGFDWYRAFPQDAEDNLAVRGDEVRTPVLYLRGDSEVGDLDSYLEGLRQGGLRDVRGRLIANCGHFAIDEQPEAVARALCEFIGLPK